MNNKTTEENKEEEDNPFYPAGLLKENPNKNRTIAEVLEVCTDKTEQKFKPLLEKNGLQFPPKNLQLVAFKEERKLEIYSENKFLTEYKFTAYSGKRGPKQKEGDKQIPEGIYGIELLNPNSKFHISLKINYPNSRDKKRAQLAGIDNAGSDIYIHGKRVSIGCVAIGDTYIEEVFTLIELTKKQNVRVAIFPNDARKNGKFLPCEVCSDDIEELYAELKTELVKYNR